ncbi:hypothetical protein BDR04DRAFT_249978 [Suillus decipiens]|nr:hypothetical protein BDR04DRAFT_249978 [Suillus decipiens]
MQLYLLLGAFLSLVILSATLPMSRAALEYSIKRKLAILSFLHDFLDLEEIKRRKEPPLPEYGFRLRDLLELEVIKRREELRPEYVNAYDELPEPEYFQYGSTGGEI